MLNDYAGAIRIRFQTKEGELIEVGDYNPEMELEGGSIIIVDDTMKMEMCVKEKFLESERAAQDPNYEWEPMPSPYHQTLTKLEQERKSLAEFKTLERRGREYCIEHNLVRQVKRVNAAALSESASATNNSSSGAGAPCDNI